jgi:hypothetical protein
MITLRSLAALLVLALAGCGMEARVSSRNYSEALVKEADRGELIPPAATAAPTAMGRMMGAVTDGASATLVAVQPGSNLPTNSQAIARKIVYDAQVDLIVESVDPISKKVGSLVQEARGYVAEQTVTGSPGSQRSMRWRLRIPVEQFDSVVDSIVSLGELERNNLDRELGDLDSVLTGGRTRRLDRAALAVTRLLAESPPACGSRAYANHTAARANGQRVNTGAERAGRRAVSRVPSPTTVWA